MANVVRAVCQSVLQQPPGVASKPTRSGAPGRRTGVKIQAPSAAPSGPQVRHQGAPAPSRAAEWIARWGQSARHQMATRQHAPGQNRRSRPADRLAPPARGTSLPSAQRPRTPDFQRAALFSRSFCRCRLVGPPAARSAAQGAAGSLELPSRGSSPASSRWTLARCRHTTSTVVSTAKVR